MLLHVKSVSGMPTLSIGSTQGVPGATVPVAINYTTDTNAPALQFDLWFGTNYLQWGGVIPGNALSDHLVATNIISPGVLRVLILSFSNTAISNGVLVTVPFLIASNSPDHDEFLTFSNVLVVDPQAEVVPSASTNGVLSILVPPQFTSVTSAAGGAVHLQLTATAGRTYVIQAATNIDLPQWQPIYTNIPGGAAFGFDDPLASAFPARFYRVLASP